jgi:hypothetical protein
MGACIDVVPDGIYNSLDKGIFYRGCLPVANADFNKSRLYKLQITDEFGNDECTGVVRVVPVAPGLAAVPTVHFVILDEEMADVMPAGEAGKRKEKISGFKVLPNPGIDHLRLEWEAISESPVRITIASSTGVVISSQEYTGGKGQNQMVFDMSAWGPGVYVVSLQSGDAVEVARWLKVGE